MASNFALPKSRLNSQKSEAPTDAAEIAIVKMLSDAGFQHKRIAALFDCNQGRIAEIVNGHKGASVSYQFQVMGASS